MSKKGETNRLLKIRVLQVQSDLQNIGINSYPREELLQYCPFTSPGKIVDWNTRARNVWNTRTVDEDITIIFENLYHKLKETGEIEVVEPKEIK